jgi:IS30 family transposase
MMGQLTKEQRYTISEMYSHGYKQKEIAMVICRDKSVVSRELKRNSNPKNGMYTYVHASKLSEMRKRRLRRPRKFTKEMELRIRRMLLMDWSPEQIVGFSRRKGWLVVSMERIYQYLHEDKRNGGILWKHCRHRLRLRSRPVGARAKSWNHRSIEERPREADGSRFGDFEMDLMIGSNNADAVLTVVERKTGYTWIRCLPNGKEAIGVADAIVDLLKTLTNVLKTITTDNGKEFSRCDIIESKLGVDVFFAHPRSPWEKGLIEYTNKLYRQYLHKRYSFRLYSQEELNAYQDKLNNRPRKKLGFHTPKELFLLYSQNII